MSYRVIETTTLFKVCQHAEVKTEVCAKIPISHKHRRSQNSTSSSSSKKSSSSSRKSSSSSKRSSSNKSAFDDETSCTAPGFGLGSFLRTVFWAMFAVPSTSSKEKEPEKPKHRHHKTPQNFIETEGLCSICTRKADYEKKAAQEAFIERERARKINERKLRFRCEKCVKEERFCRDRSVNGGLCCEFGRAFWTARGYDYSPSSSVPAHVQTRARAPSVNSAIGKSHRSVTTASSTNHLIATADRARSRTRAQTINSSRIALTQQVPGARSTMRTTEMYSNSSRTPKNTPWETYQNSERATWSTDNITPNLATTVAPYTQAPALPSVGSQRAIPLHQTLHLDLARWNSQIPVGRGTYPSARDPAPAKPLPPLPTPAGGKRKVRSNSTSRSVEDHTPKYIPPRTALNSSRVSSRHGEASLPPPSSSSSISSYASSQLRNQTRPMAREMAKLDRRIGREMNRWEKLSKLQQENMI
jgi:hypothetical protein